MNRAIKARGLNAIYVTGPGHGGPGLVASAYLDRTYSEVYPHIGRDEEGLGRLFRQFSFPGGIPSHVAPETPGLLRVQIGGLPYAERAFLGTPRRPRRLPWRYAGASASGPSARLGAILTPT